MNVSFVFSLISIYLSIPKQFVPAMFEYSKQILTKVSFDRKLFNKELNKAIAWLKNDERKLLMVWCLATFGNKYGDIITQAFRHMVK